jgi:L-amino acid N-acyltransferase YncA
MAVDSLTIRSARESDAAAMLAIYRPYVETTTISFEEEVPSLEEFEARLRKYIAGWVCLAAETNGQLVGYAYGSTHRERSAYKRSVETSVYVAQGLHGKGIGRSLYEALLPKLAEKGYCNAFAGIALPNEASIGVHRAVGFEPIGMFPRVGYKFGAWRDVAWFYRKLRDDIKTEAK